MAQESLGQLRERGITRRAQQTEPMSEIVAMPSETTTFRSAATERLGECKMADARQVLEAAVEELWEQTQRPNVKVNVVKDIAELAHEALHSESGTVSDNRVRNSLLHPSQITRILSA